MRIKIDKLVAGGQGLGRMENKVFFVWEVLAGEEAEVEITKSKKNFCEGRVSKIISAAKERIPAREQHYLSCSPWQILSWVEELKWKKLIAQENFSRLAKIELPDKLLIEADEKNQYHYRNRIEYNFIYGRGELHWALFERKTNDLRLIEECCLAKDELNAAAKKILIWLNTLDDRKSFSKMVILGNGRGEILAGLFVKSQVAKIQCPLLDEKIVGVAVFEERENGRAVLLDQQGQKFIEEIIKKTQLRFGLDSFFQVNVPLFTIAVNDMKKFVNKRDAVVDYFSGVGAIGLLLADKFKQGVLVEENNEAADFAEQNIALNKIENCAARRARAADAADLIGAESVLVLDPPRAGLEKVLVEKIVQIKPKRLIYLSCDIATQARDVSQLKEFYNLAFVKLYNFFPRTPHIECLCVLERK